MPKRASIQGKKRKKQWTASAMGKVGGPLGAKARNESLSPEERKEIASKAANARWAKYRKAKEVEKKGAGDVEV